MSCVRDLYALLLLLVLSGCAADETRDDGGMDGRGALDGGATVCVEEGPPVDVLFVMQSNSDVVNLAISAAEGVPSLVRRLLTGDLDDDGARDSVPVPSVRLGVVSSTMGLGEAVAVAGTSSCDYWGDDGVLAREPVFSTCLDGPTSPFVDVESPTDGDTRLRDFQCRLFRGNSRCVPALLESMMKAITPESSAIRFRDGTAGHGSGLNSGFLREHALWVIIIIASRDDCSIEREVEAWSTDPVCPHTLPACCEEWLYPIDRYVEGLASLRPDGLRRVAVATWIGTDRLLADDLAHEEIPWDALVMEPAGEFRWCELTANFELSPRLALPVIPT